MARTRRYDIKKLLQNPDLRRKLIVESTVAAQAREGVDVSSREAENSYYVVTEGGRGAFFSLAEFRSNAGESDGRHIEFVRGIGGGTGASRFDVAVVDFTAIDGSPLAYDRLALIGHFFRNNPQLDPGFADARRGGCTGDDERLVRYWWEDPPASRCLKPFAKGGAFSRFYAPIYMVIAWDSDRSTFEGFTGRKGRETERPESVDFYFRSGLTWSHRSQRGFSLRRLPKGCVFSHIGPSMFSHDADQDWYLLGVMNSSAVDLILRSLVSFGIWQVGAIKKVPIPPVDPLDRKSISDFSLRIHDLKARWDTGNEISPQFSDPWLLAREFTCDASSLLEALRNVIETEQATDLQICGAFAELDQRVYDAYGVNKALRVKLLRAVGSRPAEVVWQVMEGKGVEQKRREHVDRLLCYLIKKILEADEDGLVCMEAVAHEPPLLARLRKELHACFPQQDATSLEGEVLNELKKKVKGYRRAESLEEWVQDLFFDTHASLYLQRPLLWHLASSQTRRVPAFGVLVHSHKFGRDALAKLRSTHIRDRIATLKREAGQARQDGREDDRLQALADIEEVEAFDAKLKLLQEGAHRGPEGGPDDYRILTPWKSPSERPQGWDPDLDDGIKVNIAPLARTGLLRTKARFGEKDPED